MHIIKIKELSLPGKWLSDNVFCPDVLARELTKEWTDYAVRVGSWFPDVTWFVSSIRSDYTGRLRSGKSHPQGHALDMAPCHSKTQVINPANTSPRMADDRAILGFLARKLAKTQSIAIAVEGDHFHIDKRLPLGTVWAYSTYRPSYRNDVDNNLLGSFLDKKFYRVLPDGSYKPVSVTDAMAGKMDEGRIAPVSVAFARVTSVKAPAAAPAR